jgi:hypothetical protein
MEEYGMHWKLSIWRWRYKRWRKERQEIRSLKKAITQVEKEYAPRLTTAEGDSADWLLDDYMEAVSPYQPKLNYIKSNKLLEKARDIGIEIPADKPGWFNEHYDCYSERAYKVLSYQGQIRLRKMIRKQRRENIEWWFTKIILPTLGSIIALLSLIVAIIALQNK